jgi:trehalose-6-phosphatase
MASGSSSGFSSPRAVADAFFARSKDKKVLISNDIDRTLVGDASSPLAIHVPQQLKRDLLTVNGKSRFHVVFNTARSVGYVERPFGANRFDIIACGGALYQLSSGLTVTLGQMASTARGRALVENCAEYCTLEDKHGAFTLHFGTNMREKNKAYAILAAEYQRDRRISVVDGHNYVEVINNAFDKGRALAVYVRNTGRDDWALAHIGDGGADLPALKHVLEQGGIAVFVGSISYPSRVRAGEGGVAFRLRDYNEVQQFYRILTSKLSP